MKKLTLLSVVIFFIMTCARQSKSDQSHSKQSENCDNLFELVEKGYYKQAKHLFKKCGIDPKANPMTLYAYGSISYYMGDLEGAKDFFLTGLMGLQRDSMIGALYLSFVARIDENMGQIDTALKEYYQAVEVYEALSSYDNQIYIYSNIARLYSEMGESQKLIEIQKQINDLVEIMPDTTLYDKLYSAGLVMFHFGEYNQALDAFESAMAFAMEYDYIRTQGLLLTHIISCNYMLGHKEALLKNLATLSEIYQLTGNEFLKIDYLEAMGQTYSMEKKFQKALSTVNEAIELATTMSYAYKLPELYLARGQIGYAMETYEKSIDDYKKAIDLSDQYQRRNNKVIVLQALGSSFMEKKMTEEAIAAFTESLDLSKKMEAKQHIIANLHALGLIYFKQEKYREAIPYFTEALENLNGTFNSALNTYFELNLLAICYFNEKNALKAEEYATAALKIAEEAQSIYMLAKSSYELGRIYAYLKQNIDKAISYLSDAVDYYKAVNDRTGEARAKIELLRLKWKTDSSRLEVMKEFYNSMEYLCSKKDDWCETLQKEMETMEKSLS